MPSAMGSRPRCGCDEIALHRFFFYLFGGGSCRVSAQPVLECKEEGTQGAREKWHEARHTGTV